MAKGTAVEVRGRWPKISGDPTGRVILGPNNASRSLLRQPWGSGFEGASLLRYSSENLDIPERLTLNMSVRATGPADVAPDVFQFLQGRVRYGFGKSQTDAFFDVRHGTQLALEASTVQVDVGYGTVITGGNPTQTFEVFGSLSYGASGYDSQRGSPTLTDGTMLQATSDSISAAAAALTPTRFIPPRARAITVYQDSGPQIFDLVFRTGIGALPFQFNAPGSNPVVIPNGADFVAVRNNDIVSREYVYVYDLAL